MGIEVKVLDTDIRHHAKAAEPSATEWQSLHFVLPNRVREPRTERSGAWWWIQSPEIEGEEGLCFDYTEK